MNQIYNKNVTLVCDESFDGIMTAVYDGWVLMNKGCNVQIHPGKDYAPTFFLSLFLLKRIWIRR